MGIYQFCDYVGMNQQRIEGTVEMCIFECVECDKHHESRLWIYLLGGLGEISVAFVNLVCRSHKNTKGFLPLEMTPFSDFRRIFHESFCRGRAVF